MIKIYLEFSCAECECNYILGIIAEKTTMRESWLSADDNGLLKIKDSGMITPECPWCSDYVKEDECSMPVITFDKEDM